MSTAQDYFERLHDLIDDMASDEIDAMDVIFSIVLEYAEEELADEEDKTLKVEYDDKILVIGIEPLLAPIERLH